MEQEMFVFVLEEPVELDKERDAFYPDILEWLLSRYSTG